MFKTLIYQYDPDFYQSIYQHMDFIADIRCFTSPEANATLGPWDPWEFLYYDLTALAGAAARNEKDTLYIVSTINDCVKGVDCTYFIYTYPLLYRLFILLSEQMNHHAVYSGIIEQLFETSPAYCRDEIMFKRVTTALSDVDYHFKSLERALIIENDYAVVQLLQMNRKYVLVHLLSLDSKKDLNATNMLCKYLNAVEIRKIVKRPEVLQRPALLQKLLLLEKDIDYVDLLKNCIGIDVEESFTILLKHIRIIPYATYDIIIKHKKWNMLLILCKNGSRCNKDVALYLLNNKTLPNDVYLSILENYKIDELEVYSLILKIISTRREGYIALVAEMLSKYGRLLDRIDLLNILVSSPNRTISTAVTNQLRNNPYNTMYQKKYY